MVLDSAWLPHGRFRGERRELHPSLALGPEEAADVELPVGFDEEPEEVVENAFLILTGLWREEPWRTLVRLTVRAGADGAPRSTTETMTLERVGFSERQGPQIE